MPDESLDAVITSALDAQFGADRDTGDEASDVSDTSDADDVETEGGTDDESDAAGDDTADAGRADETSTAEDEESGSNDDDEAANEEAEDALSDDEKELAELGIRKPKKGQRENKIPYSRTVKIFGNAKKKWQAEVDTVIKGHTDKIASYEDLIGRYKATDDLIHTDPDRFMQVLAHLNPVYQKFLTGGEKQTSSQSTVDDANDPRPAPDYEYPDGSKGYTPEGFEKVLAWNSRRAVAQALATAKKEWEKELSPIKQEREQRERYQRDQEARSQRVQSQISRARKVWGDKVLNDNKAAIIAKLNEDKTLDFGDAVAAVMYPLLSKTRDTIRGEVVKELQDRPAAAARRIPAGSARSSKKTTDEMSTEEVIMESLREQGLVR